MSPPPITQFKKLIVQEGAVVGKIPDLDNSNESEESQTTALNLLAVEHAEGPFQVVKKDGVDSLADTSLSEYKKCLIESKLHQDIVDEELVLVSLSQDAQNYRVNHCLGEADGGYHSTTEKFQSDETTPEAPRRKRKGSFRRQNRKRRKVAARRSNLAKTTTGSTTTVQTSGATATGATTSGATTTGQCNTSTGPGGGRHIARQGSGGDDGDGDDQRKASREPAHYSPYLGGSKKEIKKVDSSSPSKMEVDESLSSKMEVCSSTSDKEMKATNSPTQSQEPVRPEEKLPGVEFLLPWHCRINHWVAQLDKNCICPKCKPKLVERMLCHTTIEINNACVVKNCRDCHISSHIISFHREKCKLMNCWLCERLTAKKVPKRIPSLAPNICVEQILNIPTAGNSLDFNERVIYKDLSFGNSLSHFKEHRDYTKEAFLAKGGNGSVHDIMLHEQFKKQHPHFASEQCVVKEVKGISEDEVEMYKATTNHPNFVKTHMIVQKDDGYRIIMEKCDGSLYDHLSALSKDSKTIDLYEAMHFWIQILDGVVYLHNQRIPIIHKDIKAKNVMLTKLTNFVRAKLGDFDAVKLLHHEFTKPGLSPRGTPLFAAPEVMRRLVHGRPADIFSLGKTLLEMLCQQDLRNPKVAIEKLKKLDPAVGAMIEKCIEENPENRPTAVQLQKSDVVRRFSTQNAL